MKNIHNYDDIIALPHHVSKKHPQMSLEDRAAQFAPFAALTGHKESIKEIARITDLKKILDENQIETINLELQHIQEQIKNAPLVKVTYFISDDKKDGGKYVTKTAYIKKIDEYQNLLILEDNLKIKIVDIYCIKMLSLEKKII